MAAVDLVDETFVVALPEWWPVSSPIQRRGNDGGRICICGLHGPGLAGQRWSMTGALVGSLEIWIEPFADGCILHHYLRGNPPRMDAPPDSWPDTPAGWRAALPNGPRGPRLWKRAYNPEVPARGRSSRWCPARLGDWERWAGATGAAGWRQRRTSRGKGRPVAQQTESSIVIDASAAKAMEVIADLGTYPEWGGQGDTSAGDVPDGRPKEVEMTIDTGPIMTRTRSGTSGTGIDGSTGS